MITPTSNEYIYIFLFNYTPDYNYESIQLLKAETSQFLKIFEILQKHIFTVIILHIIMTNKKK